MAGKLLDKQNLIQKGKKLKEMIKKGKECSALVEEYLRTEDENTIVVEHNCCNFIKYFYLKKLL